MALLKHSPDEQGAMSERVARRPVNGRSLILGLLGVCFVSILTPYNDFAVANTYFIGNFLPIGLLLFFLIFLLLINAPLIKWAPRWSFSSGELAVALSMMMVGCTVPSSGLMRYLPANLVGVYNHAGGNREYAKMLESLDLPEWIFPTFSHTSVADRANEPVIRYYMERIPQDSDAARAWRDILAAWVPPAIAWGIFVGAMFIGVICLMVIVRRQWVENERLAFPLAGVYLSLIEAPERGRVLNRLFRSKGFWIAGGLVFGIHSINAMAQYDPLHWPTIPLGYDFYALFSDSPWMYLGWMTKASSLYFSVIGITFFLQSKIAFSLWFLHLMLQVSRMVMGTYQQEMAPGMETDQMTGSALVFAIMILWIGRAHWMLVIRQMFRKPAPDEAQGRYLPYFLAGWGFVGSMVVMACWFMAAGATAIGAVAITLLGMAMFLIVARVVSETGLMFMHVQAIDVRMWTYAANGLGYRAPLTTVFLTSQFSTIFMHDPRETLSGYTSQALKVADEAAYPEERSWKRVIPYTLSLVLAVGVAYGVAGASTLWVEYSFAATLDNTQRTPLNVWGVDTVVKLKTIQPVIDLQNTDGPVETHSRAGHFTFGAGVTAALAALRLRFASWPLHPVGFLLIYSMPVGRTWLSIFIGWLLKVILVQYGGIRVFQFARPVFIGLIVGEAGAAACWLTVSLVRVWMGLDYRAISLLPG